MKHPTFDEQLKTLHAEGLWDNEIARRLNVSPPTVKRHREALGLRANRCDLTAICREPVYIDETEARRLYDEGLSDWQIGQAMGKDVGKIRRWRIACGLQPNRRHDWTDADRTEAQRLYNEGKSDPAIAGVLGLDTEAVRQWRLHERLAPNRRRKLDETEVRRLYDEGKTDTEIAAAIGASNVGVRGWRERNGLPSNGTKLCIVGPDYDWSQTDKLIRNGASYAEITAETGLSKRAVQKRREQLGLKLPHGRPRKRGRSTAR